MRGHVDPVAADHRGDLGGLHRAGAEDGAVDVDRDEVPAEPGQRQVRERLGPRDLGSLLGVRLVLALRAELLRPVVLGLLIGVAIFFAARGARSSKKATRPDAPRASFRIAQDHPVFTAAAIGLVMGTYDGFFGPGTGAFLIVLFTTIFGDDLVQATANAKVANFASNLGAVASFALAGAIDFRLALPMAVAQGLGGIVGARAALRGGERLIRAGVVVVTLALAIRIGWQMSH